MRHVNLQRVHIEVCHLFADAAELAYSPVHGRHVGAVLANHRTDVAKLIHALVGVKLVLVASAFHFLAILRFIVTSALSESHSCFTFIFTDYRKFHDKPPL